MADQTGVAVIAVDPAYTSRWGAQHWQKPLTQHRSGRSAEHETWQQDSLTLSLQERCLPEAMP
jgi:hypothetical protein